MKWVSQLKSLKLDTLISCTCVSPGMKQIKSNSRAVQFTHTSNFLQKLTRFNPGKVEKFFDSYYVLPNLIHIIEEWKTSYSVAPVGNRCVPVAFRSLWYFEVIERDILGWCTLIRVRLLSEICLLGLISTTEPPQFLLQRLQRNLHGLMTWFGLLVSHGISWLRILLCKKWINCRNLFVNFLLDFYIYSRNTLSMAYNSESKVVVIRSWEKNAMSKTWHGWLSKFPELFLTVS